MSRIQGESALRQIVLKKGTRGIAYSAFYSCAELTSVTIPNSVTIIGDYAFSRCTSLTNVTIPNSVTSIGFDAFSNCTSLKSFTIPKSVTNIEGGILGSCTSLTAISVASDNPNYTSVGGVLFSKDKTILHQYPAGKTGKYTIPDSVTVIGLKVFSGCTSLTNVTIPNSVTSIQGWAFYDCTNLTITCYSGSTAHTYAKNNSILVKLLKGYTVKFNKNGGSGSMGNLMITVGKSTKLSANAFTRKGYAFSGWATSKTGSVKYKNKVSVKDIAKENKTITLYAKWTKVSAPAKAVTGLTLKSAKTKQLTVSYKAVSGAGAYRIEYSTDSKFAKAKTKTKYTTKTSLTLTGLTAKKKYYVRVTAYNVDSTNEKIYSTKNAAKNLTIK